MSDTPEAPPPFDWEDWPARRAELTSSVRAMREEFARLDPRPELDSLRNAGEKFVRDVENAIAAGDAEYRRLHPGAQFDPS